MSLVEALLALVLLGLALAMSVRSSDRSTNETVDDGANLFARAIQAALLETEANPGWTRIYIQPGGGRDSLGRAIATRVATSGDTVTGTSADSSKWVTLTGGATFGPGIVSGGTGPMGDAATSGVPVTAIRCVPGSRCVFNTDSVSDWITFYITHIDDPARVRAVVVGARGTVRVYRWRNNRWE